jgi:hypothetical protein
VAHCFCHLFYGGRLHLNLRHVADCSERLVCRGGVVVFVERDCLGWRPVVAARLSIVPVLFLAGLFKYCTSAGDTLFLGGVLGIAAFFIIKTFRSYSAPKSA